MGELGKPLPFLRVLKVLSDKIKFPSLYGDVTLLPYYTTALLRVYLMLQAG